MKALKSGAWSLGGQAANIVFTLGTLAILGRLISPKEFGVFGLVLAVQAFVLPVIDMGLQPAYIKMKEVNGDTSNVFFTINFLIGATLLLFIIGLSHLVANFYQIDKLEMMLVVLAVSLLFAAMCGQPQAVLSRDKRFDKIAIANTIVLFMGSLLVIFFAWFGLGAWALVWRLLFDSVAKFLLLTAMSGMRYKLVQFSSIKPFVKEIHFGLVIVISRLINGWASSIDKLLLAKFIPLSELGGYTRSQQLALMPDSSIRVSITTPAIAYLARHEDGRKLNSYLSINWIALFFAGTPCMVLVVFGDILLPFLLGKEWAGMGWMLQWLGVVGLAKIFQGIMTILHIDKAMVKRTIYYLLGSIPVTLIIPIFIILSNGSLDNFLACLAILSIAYWYIALWYEFTKEEDENSKIVIKTNFFKMFVYTLTICLISFGLKYSLSLSYNHNYAYQPTLMLALFLEIIISIVLFVGFDPTEEKRLRGILRR